MSGRAVNADVIAGLRARVMAHNEAHPGARTTLNALKKVWLAGWRRGQRHVGAEAAVDRHLKKLAAMPASSRSVAALAKAEFDETKHRRDQDGRFAPKGGAPAAYRGVRTPEQHRRARAENEGYRAATTQVIPETRGRELGWLIGLGGGMALGAVRGYRADKMPGIMLRGLHAGIARGAGAVSGAFMRAGKATVEQTANAMRRAAGEPEVNVIDDAADKAGRAAAVKVRRGTKRGLDWATRASLFPSRRLIQGAKDDIARSGMKGARAALHLRRARGMAAAAGAVMPGALLGYGGMRAGEVLGPIYDSVKGGRRMQKLAAVPADPRSVEVLAKAAPMAALRGLAQRLGALTARRSGASLGAKIPKTGAKGAYAAGRRILGQVERPRSVGVGAALGAASGAALGAGGAFGARRYYRDKDGKFTSKEKDVSHLLGGALGGAALGALAGAAFVRGRNRALAREIAERIGQKKVQVNAKDKTSQMTLAEVRAAIGQGKLHPEDVVVGENLPGARRAAAARAKILNAGGEARDRVIEARLGRYRAAISAGDDAWQELQLEERLRDSIAGLRGKLAFKKPPQGTNPGSAEWKAYQAARRLLSSEPVEIVTGSGKKAARRAIDDPIGDVIAAIRQLDPARLGEKGYLAAAKTGTDFDLLTERQKQLLALRVRRADRALEEFRAARAAFKDLSEKAVKAQDRLVEAKTKLQAANGQPEEVTAPLRAAVERAERHAKTASDAVRNAAKPAMRDPFGGRPMAPAPSPGAVEKYLDDLAEQWRAPTEKQQREIGKVNREAIERLLTIYGNVRAAGNMDRGRFGRAIGRAMAPAARFGRQARLIAGDVGAAVRPRANKVIDQLFGAPVESGGKVVRQGGMISSAAAKVARAYGAVQKPYAEAKAWAMANPRAVMTATTLLIGTGLADWAGDGRVNFHFERTPEVFERLLDKKHRPEPAIYNLNNGRETAFLLLGRTVATKDRPSEPIVLSGIVYDEKENAREVKRMMPLRLFLQNAQGGGGGGGGSKVRLSSEQAKLIGDALAALKTISNATKTYGDEEWSWRARDQSNQDVQRNSAVQSGASAYLDSLQEAVKGGLSKESFYAHLADIFDADKSDLLTLSQARAALIGDQKGNEKRRGLFNEGVRNAYEKGDGNALFGALKQQIENAPPWEEGQDKHLYRAVFLLQKKKGEELLSKDQVRQLHGLIEKRAKGAGGAEASRSPSDKPVSGGGENRMALEQVKLAENIRGFFEGASVAERDSIRAHLGVTSGIGSDDFSVAVDETAAALMDKAIAELQPKGLRGDALYRAARIKALQDYMTGWATAAGLGNKTLARIDAFIRAQRDPLNRAMPGGGLAKLQALSDALLAKAEIPPAGPRRPFEESKVRRNPRGSDRGGEFAPKGGPARSGAPSRQRQPRPRAAPEERSYFEPVRFGGALGAAAGSQAGFEAAARFLPGPLRHAGIVGRLAYRLSAATAGGVAGELGGEAAGRATYADERRAPPPFEPRNRSLTEEAARMAGGTGGALLGALSRSPVKGFAIGVGGQLAGEELAAAAHDVIARHYGREVAARAARATLPLQRQAA